MIKNILQWILVGTVALASNPDPSNTLKFGDGTASNKNLTFNRNQGGLNPAIRWNESGTQLEFTNDGTNYSGIGSGSGSGTGLNLIATNPDFENGVALGWAASGSSAFLPVTSGGNLLFGKGSATFQTFGSGQVQSILYNVPVGLQNKPCAVSVYYKGGDNNLVLSALDGSSTLLASAPFTASAGTNFLSVPMTCPVGQVRLQISGAVSSALIAFDRTFLGEASNLIQVSQASFFGSMIKTTTTGANCQVDFGVETSSYGAAIGNPCTFVTAGQITATAAPDLGWTANVPPGTYLINMNFALNFSASGGNPSCRVVDDLGNQVIATYQQANVSANLIPMQTANQPITYTVGGNRTYQVQCRDLTTSNHLQMYGAVDFVIAFNMWKFPLASQVATNPATSSWLVDVFNSSYLVNTFGPGYQQNSGQTQTINTGSIAAQIPCSGTNPPQTGGCTSGNAQDGVSFIVPVPGLIQVCETFNDQISGVGNSQAVLHIDQTANADDSVVITTGTNNLREEFSPSIFTANSGVTTICEKYNVLSAGQVTFRLSQQVSVSSGHWSPQYERWTARPVTQPVPAPILMNQVVSSSVGVELFNRAAIHAPPGGPCTITDQSGSWLASAAWVTTGECTLTLNPVYGSAPQCTATSTVGGFNRFVALSAPTTSSISSFTYSVGSLAQDADFDIICMGPIAAP